MHRILLLAGCLAGATTFPAVAAADARAKAEVSAALERLSAARSYRAVIEDRGPDPGTMRVEYVAPDRLRITHGEAGVQTLIGDRMYLQFEGRTMQQPAPAGQAEGFVGQWRHVARMMALEPTQVEARGAERLGGTEARRFRITSRDAPGEVVTVWLGARHVLRIDMSGGGQALTIRYSDVDSPEIRIDAPR